MSAGEEFEVYKGIHGQAKQSTSQLRELEKHEVLIRITHAGLCFTDVHYLEGNGDDGIVLGHEPVGVIEKIGSEVKHRKAGDRVGYGYNHGCCEVCTSCRLGHDTLCAERKMYGETDFHQGGFGKYVIINEMFTHRIPEKMSSEEAAPLQCAGATVFSPFLKYGILPIHRVGIIGIGGLGHLALQVARAWGCHVTAFSTRQEKAEEAKSFGAHEVLVTKVPEGQSFVPQNESEKFDFILCTVSGQLPWDDYISCLNTKGTLIPLGVDFGRFNAPYAPLLTRENKVGGSLVATRYEHEQMLKFCARHNIKPKIEVLDLNEKNLNTAFERLQKNDVRYRFVLKH